MKLLNVAEICPNWPGLGLETDLQGWNSDHDLFAAMVEQLQPKAYIEVGSWKGRSAVHVAKLTKDLGTKVYCCDTWLGSMNPAPPGKDDPDWLPCNYRFPHLFYQFLHNISAEGVADRVYPLPNTSTSCARVLGQMEIKGDMIYIDGDHTYDQCYMDLSYFAPLLAPGGILFGDDWFDFPGVQAAVSRFAYEMSLKVVTSGPAWILQPKDKS